MSHHEDTVTCENHTYAQDDNDLDRCTAPAVVYAEYTLLGVAGRRFEYGEYLCDDCRHCVPYKAVDVRITEIRRASATNLIAIGAV